MLQYLYLASGKKDVSSLRHRPLKPHTIKIRGSQPSFSGKGHGRRIVTTTSNKTSFPAAVAVVLVEVEIFFIFWRAATREYPEEEERTHARSFPVWKKGLFDYVGTKEMPLSSPFLKPHAPFATSLLLLLLLLTSRKNTMPNIAFGGMGFGDCNVSNFCKEKSPTEVFLLKFCNKNRIRYWFRCVLKSSHISLVNLCQKEVSRYFFRCVCRKVKLRRRHLIFFVFFFRQIKKGQGQTSADGGGWNLIVIRRIREYSGRNIHKNAY